MKKMDIIEALQIEAEKALEGFRDGSSVFQDYEGGLEIPYRLEFYEWIADIEDYYDVDPTELQGERRFETIKRLFPTTDKRRLENLLTDPKSITEDESLEWRRSLYEEDQYGIDFLILIRLELPSGETGSAIIRSYSDIPGGAHDLIDVFSSVEEGEKYLSKHCF